VLSEERHAPVRTPAPAQALAVPPTEIRCVSWCSRLPPKTRVTTPRTRPPAPLDQRGSAPQTYETCRPLRWLSAERTPAAAPTRLWQAVAIYDQEVDRAWRGHAGAAQGPDPRKTATVRSNADPNVAQL